MNEYLEHVKRVLITLGIKSGDLDRLDDNATALFADQLRQIESTLYKTIYPDLKAQQFVPFMTNINRGVEQFGYYILDKVGIAKLIKNYANELEDVGIKIDREFVKIEGVGVKYSWSIQDVYSAAYANLPLTTEKADMARMAVAEKIDDMAVKGETDVDMYGITNHPSVSLITPSTGSWLSSDGSVSATGLQMIADIQIGINTVNAKSKKALKVTTCVLPPTHLQALGQTLISSNGITAITALEVLRKIFPGVTFDEWDVLDTADAAGTGPRILFYHKSPMVLSLPVPIVFEQLPPQAQGFMFEVPCHGRVGGIVVRYPMAMGYMDGC